MCHLGSDQSAFLRINASLKDFDYKSDYPFSTIFSVPILDSFDAKSHVEFDFEDALFELLQDTQKGIVIAVITNTETRDFVTYTLQAEIGKKIGDALLEKFPDVTIHISCEEDPNWKYFFNILPSG